MIGSGHLNFTDLEDDQAEEILTEGRAMIMRGESYVDSYRKNAVRNLRAWRGRLWSDEDIAFFEAFDMTPYVFRDFRPYINQLISNQRTTRFKYELVPNDAHSYRRFLKGKEAFLEEHGDEFVTIEEASKYYDDYGDDEYAITITSFLNTIRNENKAKYVESDLFENGIISSADFIKAYYGNEHNREGSIVFKRKSIQNMFWDDNSSEYDLSDAEFIGEIHSMYLEELVQTFPDKEEELREHFKRYTNKKWAARVRSDQKDFENFYKFDHVNEGVQAKIAELWTLESERRFEVFDAETNEKRIADYGMEEEDIWDALYQKTLLEYTQLKEMEGDYESLADPGLEQMIQDMSQQRYELRATQEPIWYKRLMAADVLLEYERSPYPHGSHPYTAYFPQYTDGFFSGVMDDIFDVVIALNKAVMFREMLMAHGAKGMVIVNADVMAQSGYSPQDVADAYTQLGSIMVMKLKPGQRLDNVFLQQTTLDKGLSEITLMIRDYDARLQHITGVTPAQLGIAQSDTPASRYRMQVTEGQAANNIIFDNFVRTLELHYSKVVPMLIDIMQDKPSHVIRSVGDQAKPWVMLELDNSFDIFADAMRTGHFNLTISPVQDNPQSSAARDATYMQLALNGAMPIETAIKNSGDPRRGQILRDMRRDRNKQMMEEAALMVGIQTVQQLAAESGMEPQAVQEFVTKLQKARYAEINQQQQNQKRAASGLGAIQQQSMEDSRIDAIQTV
jgi:hypothetical protein